VLALARPVEFLVKGPNDVLLVKTGVIVFM
jgi:hypothetical protein